MKSPSVCPNGRCFPSGLGMYTRRTGLWSIRSTSQLLRQFVQPSLHAVLLDVLEASGRLLLPLRHWLCSSRRRKPEHPLRYTLSYSA